MLVEATIEKFIYVNLDEVEGLKYCPKCQQYKDVSDFSRDKRRKDGLQSWCKECSKAYVKRYNEDRREEYLSYQKNYYENHKQVFIYTITNLITGKVYVGASTIGLHRWFGHKSKLRNSVHPNLELQADWNKFGEDAFVFEIIEEFDVDDLLRERERYWINQFPEVYNLYGKENEDQLVAEEGGCG